MVLAVLLVLTASGGILPHRTSFVALNTGINIIRSVPFIILMVFILPLTKLLVGTRVGTTAALVPLVVFIVPYLTRLFENSLLEVSPGVIEAAQAMGATTRQIILRFLLPEALPSIVLAMTTGTVGLLGATAMAGYVGGGGVGDLALTYGYEKMNTALMILTVVILIVIVQLIQLLGSFISGRLRAHQS
jgi:D-methionine transport system permease protein